MKNTIVTDNLIIFSDGFVWKRLSNEKAYKIWVSAENEDFELYKVRVDDEYESLIENLEDLQDAFKQGHYVCIEVGKLPYSIDLNYLRNLQELSVEAVDYLSGLKECSREESFNIIQEWAKEFTEKYENYDFNGSYYDVIDAFIDEKFKSICEYKGITWNDLVRIRIIRPKKFLGFFRQLTGITIEGAFNRCSACVEIMANDDNGVSMMHYIDYEDIIGVELIKN